MLKLVVVGHDQERLKKIKQDIKPILELYPDLRVSAARPGYLDTVIDDKLRLLVLDTPTINKLVLPFVAQVRKSGYEGPILVLGNLASSFDVSDIVKVPGLFHLAKPYSEEQLTGIIKNSLNAEKMHQRRDQRFDVREQATLEAYSSDFKTETIINNISKSGLRIEGNLTGIKKGDLLRLHFNFDKIQKERTMSARVVWVKKEGDKGEEAGLEFVSQKAVYQYLLDYAVA